MGRGKSHLRNQCLGKGGIDGVAEGVKIGAFGDGCTITGHEEGPVPLRRRDRSDSGGVI